MEADIPYLAAPDEGTAATWQNLMVSLHAGRHSDFVIRCGGDEIRVHKNIMSLQSASSTALATVPFWYEANDGVLNLQDDNPLAVRAMIDSIYLGNYTETIMRPSDYYDEVDATDFLPLHAKVYVLADKYDLPTLRITATKNIIQAVGDDPDCVLNWPFRDTIDVFYENELDEARDIRRYLVNALVSHDSVLDTDEMEVMVRKHATLAYDVGTQLRQRHKRFFLGCTSCGWKRSSTTVATNRGHLSEACPGRRGHTIHNFYTIE